LPALAGYAQVRVIVADGAGGVPDSAPYDRIIVTAEPADVAPAWVSQLTLHGRLVLPLRLRGWTRSVVFERHPGFLLGLRQLFLELPIRMPSIARSVRLR
jgi:protein-L-isoaspartate(D-aspartate) O-methyltransferase